MTNNNGVIIFNSDVLTALSDEVRQQMLIELVKVKEMRAGDIANKFNLHRPTISHHLQILRRANIVIAEKRGKEMFYSIQYSYVCEEIKKVYELFEKYKNIHQ